MYTLNMKIFKRYLLFAFVPILIGTSFSCSNVVESIYKNTIINDSVSIKKLGIVNSTTTKDFYDKYNTNQVELKKFFFENIDKFIIDNYELIKSNFDVSISEYNSETIVLKITITKGFWYENGVLNNQKDLVAHCNLIDFHKVSNENDYSAGGSLDGGQLLVDKYKMFVEVLNLKRTTNISTITNDMISQEIKKILEFKNIILEVGENSNTKNGVLFLYISGMYKENEIKKTKITISNFINNQDYSSLKLTNLKLNYDQWFNDLKPIVNGEISLINQITTKEWIDKYIDLATFMDKNDSIIFLLKDIKEYGINFNDFGINILDMKNINIVFNGATFQNKTFINGSWINEDSFTINSIVNRNSIIGIPDENDVLNYLSSKTTINDNVLTEYYPSYFSGLASYSKKYNLNYYPEISNLINNNFKEKIKNKYFPKKEISINIDYLDGSIIANDFTSSLSFNLVTKIVDDINVKSIIKRFNFSNLKSLNNFFNQQKEKTNDILLLPPNSNNIAKRFITQLKKDNLLKTKIDSLFNANSNINESVSTNLPTASSFKSNVLNKTYIYGDDRENSEDNFDNLFKDDFNKSLFGKTFSNSNNIDFSDISSNSGILVGTGLFKYDNNNIFQLQSIKYQIDDFIRELTFVKVDSNPNLLDIRIPLKTIIDFNNKFLEQNSFFSLKLLKNQWINSN